MPTSPSRASSLDLLGNPGLRLDVGGAIYRAVGPVLLAALITALPVIFHLASQPAAIAACILLALIVANGAAPTVPIVLIFAYLFQNLCVAIVSPQIGSLEQLNSIRVYNFLTTAVVWVVLVAHYWIDRPRVDPRMRRLMSVTTFGLLLIGAYFALGLVKYGGNAVVYLRNIATPFLLLQIFALIAYRHRVSIIGPLTVVALLTLGYGYLELFGQDALFRLVNGDIYIAWRIRQDHEAGVWLRDLMETGRVMRSYLDTLRIDFLNTPLLADLGVRFFRLVGPNFHSISFAYALACFGVLLAAAGRWWYGLIVLPLVLVIGSKGALIFLIVVTAGLLIMTAFRGLRRLWWYAAMLCLYAGIGIAAGISTQDYHVIGFLGGLRGFLRNPFGEGIGAGGNLSLNVSAIDWSRSQQLGHTDVAVESAVGVLLYQMGVAAVLLIAILAWIAMKSWAQYRRTGNRAHCAVALGLMTITVNGIFHEEALFAPLALGIITAFAGLLLGATYRTVSEHPQRAMFSQSQPPDTARESGVYHNRS